MTCHSHKVVGIAQRKSNCVLSSVREFDSHSRLMTNTNASSMPEFIVEILVVVDAPSATEADRYGEQIADLIRRKSSQRVKNVIVSDVRGEDSDD